jgi:anti-sigma factor RsiW
MRDCVNGDVRDRLPELVHGRLEGAERATVESHVAECPDCAAEAALIRLVAGSAALATPRMDTRRIAAALPAPILSSPAPLRRIAGASWMRWAAGLVIAAAGIGAVQLFGGAERQNVASAERELPANSGERAIVRPVGSGVSGYTVGASRSGLVLVGGIDALSLDQLEALVLGVETLSAVPALEPDAVPLSAGEEMR